MPIFDYICKKCGYETEFLVKDYMEVKSCPTCHKPMLKQIGPVNFRLYGDGFHKPNKK